MASTAMSTADSSRSACVWTSRIRIALYWTLKLWGDCEDLPIFSPHCFFTIYPRQCRCLPKPTELFYENYLHDHQSLWPRGGPYGLRASVKRVQRAIGSTCRWQGRPAQTTTRGIGSVQVLGQWRCVWIYIAARRCNRVVLGAGRQAAGL